jgi:hypothetical protein
MPPECNILINPSHPEMKEAQIMEIEKYVFDQRLMP